MSLDLSESANGKLASGFPADDDRHADLWNRHRSGDREAYEAIVDEYLPLVKITVSRMAVSLPSFVSREDLYSAGCVGLLAAIERYDSSREAKFTTYAITRIRGAILDELRSHDILGRVVRNRVNRIGKAESDLQHKRSEINPENVAAEAGLTMDEYWDAEIGARAAKRLSISESSGDGRRSLEELLISRREEQPGSALETKELVEVVMNMLSEKEKHLVVMYYEEELTLKEIGELLKLTESRVCQMHGAMLQKIRKRLASMGIKV